MVPTPRAVKRTGALFVAAAVGGLGCGTDLEVLSVEDAAAPAPEAAVGSMLDYCSGVGPPVLVDATSDGGAVCPDELAQRAFRYALCACNQYVSSFPLITDAFDGTQGAYDPGTATPGGSVGVNGDFHPGPLQVGGSLWASGASAITTEQVQVAGDLHAKGELRPAPSLSVGGDAWLAGGLQTTGDVTVGGALHVPSGAPFIVGGVAMYGTPDPTPFTVQDACDCAPGDFVGVAGVVATYRAENDDAALGLAPDVLANVQAPVSKSLPCGRIYLTEITGVQPVHLTAEGRVAIFVGGDLSTTSDFEIDAPSGAEVDLFVAGNVTVGGQFQVGEAANPARARAYFGGTTVNLQSAASLAGNLYAPGATLTLGSMAPTTLYGAVFAGALSASSTLTIHYDESVLSSSACPATPSVCSACDD